LSKIIKEYGVNVKEGYSQVFEGTPTKNFRDNIFSGKFILVRLRRGIGFERLIDYSIRLKKQEKIIIKEAKVVFFMGK